MFYRNTFSLHQIREGHMTVCSTTLWVGHLSKLVQEDDLSDNFGTYGEVIVGQILIVQESCFDLFFPLDCINRPDSSQRMRLCLYEQENGCLQVLACFISPTCDHQNVPE